MIDGHEGVVLFYTQSILWVCMFLYKAHNFGKITRDNCLGRLTLANSRGDLDMSEDEMSKVATDQAHTAAASYLANNQLPLLTVLLLCSQLLRPHSRRLLYPRSRTQLLNVSRLYAILRLTDCRTVLVPALRPRKSWAKLSLGFW